MQKAILSTPHSVTWTYSEVLKSTSGLLKSLFLIVILLPALVVGIYCWHQRTLAVKDAESAAHRSAIALNEHAAKVLDTHALVLRQVSEVTERRSWQEISDDKGLITTLRSIPQTYEQVALIGIADADGRLRMSSEPLLGKLPTVGDREYFLAHKNGVASGLFISEAYTGRLNGLRQFAISVPRFNEEGRFDGIIYATVRLDYFQHFWKQYAPVGGYLIPLVRDDGAVLARYPAADTPERLHPDGPLMTRIRQAPRGSYTAISQVDGIERINAYTRIGEFPLYISFSIEKENVLQKWRHEIMPIFVTTVVAVMSLLALWFAVALQLYQQRTAGLQWQQAAENLANEVAHREQLEDHLRQSQKMEAVGQLTGGIAHDFNNLLAGISGNLELLRLRLRQGKLDELDRYIDVAESSTDRAAALTHRLLAFSRQQTLAPELVDINRLVHSMSDLMERAVGPSVTLLITRQDQLWAARCDPNQLENALLNLAINSRDAMPGGGSLTIETRNIILDESAAAKFENLAPGKYVRISVSDTGTGMPPDVMQRAFDPFFTTKPLGQGTGLGLSMIYGFVKQSGGYVRIDSQAGQGTMVSLYLPADEHRPSEEKGGTDTSREADSIGGAVVLIVDDQDSVRIMVREMLDEAGYETMEAANGNDALDMLRSPRRIDLLMSDIGLPGGINGRQLADEARRMRPDLKVLFITGYAEGGTRGNIADQAGMDIMTKPFALHAMLEKVAHLLRSR